MHRKLSVAVGSAIAGSVATMLFAAPAMAAQQPDTGMQPASETTAPACVNRNVINFNIVDLTNHCGRTMHLAVDWGWAAPNSSCYTVNDGQTVRVSAVNIPTANYNKTVLC